MMQLEEAMAALKPFADVYAVYERNGGAQDRDLIVRRDGNVLGHAGFTIADLKAAHDAYVQLGGEIEI